MNSAEQLTAQLHKKTARVGVIGLGYTGLPLAVELARAGFYVTGVDINEAKVEAVKQGESYITDVDSKNLKELVSTSWLSSTRILC